MTTSPMTISPGTTNHITNPAVITTTTGWVFAANRPGTRITSLPAGAPTGITTGVEVTSTDELGASFYNAGIQNGVVLPSAGAYTLSWYVYIPAAWGGGTIRILTSGYTGSSGGFDDADMDLRDTWQRLILSGQTIVAGDLTGSAQIAISGAWPLGDSFIWTAAQWEAGSTATPFVIGTRAERHLPGFHRVGSNHVGPLRVGKD